MRHFIRLNGELLEVQPLTKPHRHKSTVTVRIVRTGTVIVTEHRDIIHDY